jgi:hypothetical protein
MTSRMFYSMVISVLVITTAAFLVAITAARTPGAPHWVLFLGMAVIVGFGLQSLWTQRDA